MKTQCKQCGANIYECAICGDFFCCESAIAFYDPSTDEAFCQNCVEEDPELKMELIEELETESKEQEYLDRKLHE
jgi:hypothetical protein